MRLAFIFVTILTVITSSSAFAQLTPSEQNEFDACEPLLREAGPNAVPTTPYADLSWWHFSFDFAGCVTGGQPRYRYGIGTLHRATLAGLENYHGQPNMFIETLRDSEAYTRDNDGIEHITNPGENRINPYVGLRVEGVYNNGTDRSNLLFDGGRLDRQNYQVSGGTVGITFTNTDFTPEQSRLGMPNRASRVRAIDTAEPAEFELIYTRNGSSDFIYAWSFSLKSINVNSRVNISVDGGEEETISLPQDEWVEIAIAPRWRGADPNATLGDDLNNDTTFKLEFDTNIPSGLFFDRGQLERVTRNNGTGQDQCDGERTYIIPGVPSYPFVHRDRNSACNYLPTTTWMGLTGLEDDNSKCDPANPDSSSCFAKRSPDILAVNLNVNSPGLPNAPNFGMPSGKTGTMVVAFRPRSPYLGAGTVIYTENASSPDNHRNINWRVAGSPFQFQVGFHDVLDDISRGLNPRRDPLNVPAVTTDSAEVDRDLFWVRNEGGNVAQYKYQIPWTLRGLVLDSEPIENIKHIIKDSRVNIMAVSWDYRDNTKLIRRVALDNTANCSSTDIEQGSTAWTGKDVSKLLALDHLYFGALRNGGKALNGDILTVLISDRISSQDELREFTKGELAEPMGTQPNPDCTL